MLFSEARKVVPRVNVLKRAPTPEEWEAAQGMETLFVEQMLAEMRKSVPENDIIPVSNGEKIFRQMLDSEYARMISRSSSLGIADMVLAELQGQK